MMSFTFINDFAAAGYGLCLLKYSDCMKLDQVQP
jgi:glucokinase